MDQALLAAIEAKLPFREAKRLLVSNGLPTGVSWNAIREKLKSADALQSTNFTRLQSDFIRSLAVSEKSIRAYKLSDEQMQIVRAAVGNARPNHNNIIVKAFPYLLDKNQLDSAPDSEPRLVSKFSAKCADYLLYSAVRRQRVRELLPTNMFPDMSADYDEIYGVKEFRGQTFESLAVPKFGNYVFVLAEFPAGTTQETRRAAHSLLRNKINGLVDSDLLVKSVNFYPIIKPIYNCDAGKIKRLSYTTKTDAEKRERMRESGVCLREEIGHKSGMMALGNAIDAYDLSIVWVLPFDGNYTPKIELDFIGTYRMTYETNPSLIDAELTRCVRLEEFDIVMNTLINALHGTLPARLVER